MKWISCFLMLASSILWCVKLKAESEYDLYRPYDSAPPNMILLDTSAAMSCVAGEPVPVEGEVACGHQLSGTPPYPADSSYLERSRIAWVRSAFSQYGATSGHLLAQLGLAIYGDHNANIRIPVNVVPATPADGFLSTLKVVPTGGESGLLNGLLETAHYLTSRPLLYGRERSSPAHISSIETTMQQRFFGYAPLWQRSALSHPQSVLWGEFLLQRSAECNTSIFNLGALALAEPACANDHFLATQDLRYQGPAFSARNQSEDRDVAAKVLLISAGGVSLTDELEASVAGNSLGTWIHRFLADDDQAIGNDKTCRPEAGLSGVSLAQNCLASISATLWNRHHIAISVIVLGENNDFLQTIAQNSGGHYYTAKNQEEILSALKSEIPERNTSAENETFPGSILPTYAASGTPELFMTEFLSSSRRSWLGNLKRYSPGNTEMQVGSATAGFSELLGNTIGPCRDGSQGCILATARSDWNTTTAVDGNVVTRSGAANKLDSKNNRNIWIQTGNAMVPILPARSIDELDALHRNVITEIATTFGMSADQSTSSPYEWNQKLLYAYNQLAGVDQNNAEYNRLSAEGIAPFNHVDERRQTVGASVFGAPVIVKYSNEKNQIRRVVWWSATDGFLRATDAETGESLSEILPAASMGSAIAYNQPGNGDVIAGLDGAWVALEHDENHDGVIQRHDGDYTYLYGGMRRGGNHVYAWDVTEPRSPKILFDLSPQTHGLEALADTWSTPLLTKLQLPGRPKPETLLVFGGGYDRRLDAPGFSSHLNCQETAATCGAGIYFVKASGADAGKLLWRVDAQSGINEHTQASELTAPVVAPLRSVDTNGDGIAEALYAVDIEGRVFRLRASSDAGQVGLQVSLLAELGAADALQWDRAFFFAPSIAATAVDNQGTQVTLALGSGNFTQPGKVSDRGLLYLLKDHPATAVDQPVTPESKQAIWISPDAQTKNSTISESSMPLAQSPLWVLPLQIPGEKLISAPMILDHKAFFKTYRPACTANGSCTTRRGSQALWAINLDTGTAVFDAVGNINPAHPTQFDVPAGSQSSALTPVVDGSRISLLDGVKNHEFPGLSSRAENLRWKQWGKEQTPVAH